MTVIQQFTLTDFDLIKRDLANAFNIQQGEIPGRPEYGTILWSFVFEPQIEFTQAEILAEVQRVAAGDPRIYLAGATAYPQENGILIELQVQVVPSDNVERLAIFFDQETRRATYV